jgi:hypothetical protein
MEPDKIEKIICIVGFFGIVFFNKSQEILNWWAENPLMWTDSVGYLPIVLIIISFWLSPHILKRLRQQK